MIDPILSLAFSMHSNKGVYALLLGSGVSRSAGIPTGWEVTLDLIRKLAHLQGENCEPDPAKWYEEKYSEEADYSKILKLVAKTSSERSKLLKAYFEPTEEERKQNIKTPTIAHKAIADLVARGYVKVILTTNFDRLIEKALEEVGVIPTVISTNDAIAGATPITHSTCTVIKLHGDYLDTRIKNTPEELATYDRQLNTLLDRLLDEFGLIICGWSGEWDIALGDSVRRCKSRRYTTFWTVKDSLADKAKVLADLRKAEVIRIHSSDAFFSELAEKLLSISEFDRPHPLSAQAAVATLKRYLEDEKYKIRLRDLVMQEVENLHENTSVENFPLGNVRFTPEELSKRVQRYESLTEILQAMAVVGGFWGNHNLAECFTKALERLTDFLDGYSHGVWTNLRLYPSLIMLYSTGLAALAAQNYEMLVAVLIRAQDRSIDREPKPLILSLSPAQVMETNIARQLPNHERQYFPVSEHLFQILAAPLKEFLPNSRDFEETFDRLEFFCALAVADLGSEFSRHWLPMGRFGWKYQNGGVHISKKIQLEIERDGENWLPLKSGFGSLVVCVATPICGA
ncbi:MAG: SIR2 family protein [Chloroflexota bacterium]